jgi:hypothetical protein
MQALSDESPIYLTSSIAIPYSYLYSVKTLNSSYKKGGIIVKERALLVVMIFALLAALSGCAGSKTYLVKMGYHAEKKATPTEKAIGICPFEDLRKEKDKDLIGIRRHGDKRVDFIKLHGLNLSDAVTQAVKDFFTDHGFQITDCKGWDQSPEGLDRLPGDLALVVGGKIDSFMVEAESGIMTTTTQYTVKMRALIGNIKERTVVTRTIESMPKETRMGFDPDHVKEKLNGLLTEALNKLLAE